MMKHKFVFVCVMAGIFLCACGSNRNNKEGEANAKDTDNVNIQEQDTLKNNTPTSSDLVFINTIEELWNGSDTVVKAKIEKRTEIGDEIEYDLKINEWIKGSDENDVIKLRVWNNVNNTITDVKYFDFNEDETYVFFLNHIESRECYGISCQTAGLIKVEEDNTVEVQEYDPIFKECKTYEDVTRILKTQIENEN